MSKRPLVIFGILAVICVVVLPSGRWPSGVETPLLRVRARQRPSGNGAVPDQLRRLPHPGAAGTDGIVGPNLDVRFGTGSKSSLQRSTYTTVLDDDPEWPRRPHAEGILRGAQAKAVAQFVAATCSTSRALSRRAPARAATRASRRRDQGPSERPAANGGFPRGPVEPRHTSASLRLRFLVGTT